MQIKPWDYIVHIDHGVWIFKEIIEKDLGWIKKEYITLEYKNWDKLFVPITEVSRVSKYVWVENPKLTWLSTKDWEKKIKESIWRCRANCEWTTWNICKKKTTKVTFIFV